MIDKKTILSVTHGGLDVFKRYFGADCEKKLFRNPYREDRKASCHLYLHEGHDGLSRLFSMTLVTVHGAATALPWPRRFTAWREVRLAMSST